MFVIHSSIESFLETRPDSEVYVDVTAEYRSTHGILESITTVVLVTTRDESGIVNAARIVIEPSSQMPDRIHPAMVERQEIALDKVRRHIWLNKDWMTKTGVLTEPGMIEVLRSYSANHSIWKWDRYADGPGVRKMIFQEGE